MSFPLLSTLLRRASWATVAVLFAASFAYAQSAPSQNQSSDQYANQSADQSSTIGYSSSQAGLSESGLQLAEFSLPDAANPAAFGGGSGAGQYGQGGESGGGGQRGLFHHLTFEAGGGFNAPIGNDTSNGGGTTTPAITWGGNFTLGAGFHFSKRISALLEYQFIGDKLPGALISAVNNANGDQYNIIAGNTHINSITGSPVIDLFPKKSNGVYLVGGFGWYHKSTNFQTPELTFDEFGDEYDENVTVASFTSSQWGGNAGLGIYHRLGGNLYGPDSAGQSEIFAEARYTFIHTPPISQSNGLGTTELIPVTVGIRF